MTKPLFRHLLLESMADSVRYGFATNSSSTHSICLLPEAPVGPPAGWYAQEDDAEFGWGTFALTTREQKLTYLGVDMTGQVQGIVEPKVRWFSGDFSGVSREARDALPDVSESSRAFAKAFTILALEDSSFKGEGCIDHDSTFSFPLENELPHIGFARWFRDRIVDNPRVVVFGGNDNKTKPPKPAGAKEYSPLPDDEYGSPMRCFDRGDHWLLWEAKQGAKLRLPKVEGAQISHTTVPELVDLKVTDFCSLGCAYCYQGSTKRGTHTSVPAYRLVRMLADLGVLEVAVGGGEPTEWPDLPDFIEGAKDKFVVNLTTRRPEALEPGLWTKVGRVGFSVDKAEDLQRVALWAEDDKHPAHGKIVAHVVLGSAPLDEIVQILQIAQQNDMEVLLLGYKTDGRGARFKPHDHENWVDRLVDQFTEKKRWTGPMLGVDTAIAQTYGDALRTKLHVAPKWMVGKEGAFSCYIDTVTMTLAKASYGGGERWPLPAFVQSDFRWEDQTAKQICETFHAWQEPSPA